MLKRKGLPEFVAEGRVRHVHSLGAHVVTLPPMPIGATFLERWEVTETPGVASWRDESYMSVAPALFEMQDVTVHSSAGMIQIDDFIVVETMHHTIPSQHGYETVGNDVILLERPSVRLPGTSISVLAGGKGNYFHAVMFGTFRLSMLPQHYLGMPAHLLCTANAVRQASVRELLHLPAQWQARDVADSEAVRVETLLFPLTVHDVAGFHPCIQPFFDRVSRHVPDGGDLPRRFYVDRQQSQRRRLANESDVIEALRPLGFVPIKVETLSIADQVRLFRGAEAIVAPHGAGLTNLGFCRPGCIILELQLDAYMHWLFRHLAALTRLNYDCVVGRSIMPPPGGNLHQTNWQISPTHVIAAITQMLADQG